MRKLIENTKTVLRKSNIFSKYCLNEEISWHIHFINGILKIRMRPLSSLCKPQGRLETQVAEDCLGFL